MDGRDIGEGGERPGAAALLRAAAVGLRCSRAELLALAVLVAGAFAALGLLWLLAATGPAGGQIAPPAVSAGSPVAVPVDDARPGGGPPAGARREPAVPGTGSSGASPIQPGAVSPPTVVVVHVVGQVAAPGVYRLPAGSRIADALTAAGGARADADLAALNLARPLADGEQVLVPAPGDLPVVAAPPAASAGGGGAAGAQGSGARRPDGLLDLNLADAADLDELPGVGPVLAQRILDHRAAIGRFTSVDELRDVKGIGDATFTDLAPQVTV